MKRLSALIASLSLAAACMPDSNLAADGDRSDETGVDALDPSADVSELRIDVYPAPDLYADAEGAPTLLPQTFDVDLAGENRFELLAPVLLQGLVSGTAISPWLSADLPGSTEPIAAAIQLAQARGVQGAATSTDAEGRFGVLVAPGRGYQLAVVPDRADVPLWVDTVDVMSDTTLPVAIPGGSALWGRVLTAEGGPFAEAAVRAVHASGVAGPWTRTDADGNYVLRVAPGLWTLQSQGRQNGRDPLVSIGEIEVDTVGAQVDLRYGPLAAHGVGGTVTSPSGPVVGATVRLTAQSLDGYEHPAALTVEVSTNAPGNFDTRVPAGTYAVEVLPARGVALSPRALTGVRVTSDTDLGTMLLSRFSRAQVAVVDPAGVPVAGASVQAIEAGHGRRSFTAVSDDLGLAEIDLPDVPLEIALIPPSNRPDLALSWQSATGGEAMPAQLVFPEGQQLTGRIEHREGARVRGVQAAVVEIIDLHGVLRGVAVTNADGDFNATIAWPPPAR